MKVFMAKRRAFGLGRLVAGLAAVARGLVLTVPALAESVIGAPAPWGVG